MNNMRKKGAALIIGGGIAGLLSARVLSDYYEEVVIVEKDDFPASPEDRAGTPQSFHPHRFTQRGKEIMTRLFPDFEQDLAEQGARSVLNKTVHNMNQHGSVVVQYPRNDYKFSRALLEWVVRKRVREIPGVRFLPKHDVLRLLTTPDHAAVTGIAARERGANGQEKFLMADLVVDTSGRSSKLNAWLEKLGYDVPKPDLLKVNLGYSTRRYRIPPSQAHLIETWDTVIIGGQPANGTFSGVFSIIENQIAEVLLYRPGGHYPPTDAEQFEQAVAQLPSPLIAELLQGLEPITNPRGFRVPALHRHHFEQMDRWPSGLLVLGDAFCIYDPIFGQGMTVAAIEAEVLEACLREQWEAPRPHFEQRALRSIQAAIEPAWWLNCANDLQWEGVEYEGAEPLKGISFGRKYLDLHLERATAEPDFKLFGLYWAVNTLSVSPREMLNPDLVTSVLSASDEGRQWLAELTQQYGQPLEHVWDDIVPSFSEAPYPSMSR